MKKKKIHAVTGAYGYSGKYIARRLVVQGHPVITITNSPNRANPFGNKVRAFSFNFDDPDKLAESLKGVSVLYNTYWVRFNHKLFTHADTVRNTITMFEAAKQAGVERIVHVSITNPSKDSHLEYFSGKARVEDALQQTGIPYSILRPTVLFGKEDILINNIAWALRRLPLLGLFGDGEYSLQPIYVDDLAELAVTQGQNNQDTIINAIGPETFTYKQLVKTIANIISKKRLVISMPPAIGLLVGGLIGKLKGDVFITRDEVDGMMANLLYVDSPPTGKTKLTDWAKEHAETLGTKYASELARRKDRLTEYNDYM